MEETTWLRSGRARPRAPNPPVQEAPAWKPPAQQPAVQSPARRPEDSGPSWKQVVVFAILVVSSWIIGAVLGASIADTKCENASSYAAEAELYSILDTLRRYNKTTSKLGHAVAPARSACKDLYRFYGDLYGSTAYEFPISRSPEWKKYGLEVPVAHVSAHEPIPDRSNATHRDITAMCQRIERWHTMLEQGKVEISDKQTSTAYATLSPQGLWTMHDVRNLERELVHLRAMYQDMGVEYSDMVVLPGVSLKVLLWQAFEGSIRFSRATGDECSGGRHIKCRRDMLTDAIAGVQKITTADLRMAALHSRSALYELEEWFGRDPAYEPFVRTD